jgi:hypothetical protein
MQVACAEIYQSIFVASTLKGYEKNYLCADLTAGCGRQPGIR